MIKNLKLNGHCHDFFTLCIRLEKTYFLPATVSEIAASVPKSADDGHFPS